MEVQRKQAAKVLLDFIQERFIEATDLDNDNIVMQQLPLDRDVLQQNIRKALYAEAKAHDVFPTNEQIFEFTGVYLSLMEHVRDIHRAHRALDAAMANAYRTHDEEEDEDDSKEAKDDA